MSEKRRPWGKWYWGDWRKDARLHRCSYAARGLWADMLSLMGGECEPFGFLMMEGQALDASDLVGLLGGTEREVKKLLSELEAKKVFSRAGDTDLPDDLRAMIGDTVPSATIISRRMLRDRAKDERDRANGAMGGNPSVKPRAPQPLSVGLTPSSWNGLRSPTREKPEARSEKPEQQDARAREIGMRCLAIIGRDGDPTWNYGLVHQWLADGADPERHIYPTLRAIVASGKAAKVKSLAYFTPAILEAMQRRAPEAAGATAMRDPEYDRSRAMIQLWLESGDWPAHRGPLPTDSKNTLHPKALAEFAAQIEARKAMVA